MHQGGHDLGIYHRLGDPEDLHIDLVKLAMPPLLWALVPEHGTDGVKFNHGISRVQLVLDIGSHHRSGGLGAHSNTIPAAILKGVHLLLHDISFLADAPREELRLLQDGHPYLSEAETLQDLSGALFQHPPSTGRRMKDITESPHGLDFQDFPFHGIF